MAYRPKVGILTLPLHTNFGGNLQAYALLRFLRKNSVDAYFLRREDNKLPKLKYISWMCIGILKKYLLGKETPIFRAMKGKREYEQVSVNAKQFIDNEISPQSLACYSSSELLSEVKRLDLDAVIVGSDQIWRLDYAPDIGDYFLGFLEKEKSMKRLAYAASFGVDNWQFDLAQTEHLSRLLAKFDYVSVRENSAVAACRGNLSVLAEHVLDPTMLLEVEDYTRLFSDRDLQHTGKVSTYILDESPQVSEVLNGLQDRFGHIKRLNTRTEDLTQQVENRIAPPTGDWLYGIYSTSLLVTDSFHGCIFSILFNTPFLVYGNEERGLARFESLLRDFGLEDRMIKTAEDIDSKAESIIDWSAVNERVAERRLESSTALLNALV